MKARRAALSACGAVLAVIGTVAAAFVGPDDTLMIGSHRTGGSAAGQAVRTHPEITDFVNIDLLVRAEAPGGVFLGSLHRVDTESLLFGRRHYEITRMALGDVGGGVTGGSVPSTRKALKPHRLVGWHDSERGKEVEIVVPLTGDPVDVVAVPNRADEQVKLSFGAHVSGLFWTQVALVLTGLAMIALSWLVGWWLRRRDERRGDGPTPTPGPGPERLDGRTRTSTPQEREPLPLPPYPGARRIAALGALVALVLVATGCSVPGAAPADSAEQTRTGISLTEARLLVPDAAQVYAGEFASYPMWSLVVLEDPTRIRVLTRETFPGPWRTEAKVRVRGELPEPVSRAIPAGKLLTERAEGVAASIGNWWSTGEIRGVALDRRTRRAREDLLASGVSPWSIWAGPPPVGTPQVRMVEVAGGHLVVVRHTLLAPGPLRMTTIVHFPAASRPKVLGTQVLAVD